MNPPIKLPNTVGDFSVRNLGLNKYELAPLASDGYIVQTGAAVTTYLELPVAHELIRVELKHTDNVDADSVDALTYSIARRATGNIFLVLASGAAVVVADIIETFGEDYPFGSSYYRLVTDTTNTDRIYPIVIIEALGGF